MRTAIYVLEPSTVTIRAVQPQPTPVLYRYRRGAAQPALGTYPLAPGIYMVMSTGEIEVTGANLTVATLRNDKDIPPDPRAVLAFELGATRGSIDTFFLVGTDAPPPSAGIHDDDDAAFLDAGGGDDDADDE